MIVKERRKSSYTDRRRAGANLACQEVAYSSRTKASPGTRVLRLMEGGRWKKGEGGRRGK